MPLTTLTTTLAKSERLLSASRLSSSDPLLKTCCTGLGHLAREGDRFQGSLSCSLPFVGHFAEELTQLVALLESQPGDNLRTDPSFFGSVQATAFALVEDMALFMREKKLRAGCAPQPEPEERIMAFFEHCGNWPKESGELVASNYYAHIPLTVMCEARHTSIPQQILATL